MFFSLYSIYAQKKGIYKKKLDVHRTHTQCTTAA